MLEEVNYFISEDSFDTEGTARVGMSVEEEAVSHKKKGNGKRLPTSSQIMRKERKEERNHPSPTSRANLTSN